MPGGLPLKVNRTPRTYLFRVRARRLCGFLRRKGALLSVGEANTPRKFEFLQKPLDKQTPFRV